MRNNHTSVRENKLYQSEYGLLSIPQICSTLGSDTQSINEARKVLPTLEVGQEVFFQQNLVNEDIAVFERNMLSFKRIL